MKPTAEITHHDCGSQVAWYLGDESTIHAHASDVMFLDFSKPKSGGDIRIKCPCGHLITDVRELSREFKSYD